MKVLLINGSPNIKGCTYTALTEVEKTLNEAGIETEIIQVGSKDLRGCIGCRQCKKNGKCVFNDLVNEVAPKFAECDGIVIGSSIGYLSYCGNMDTSITIRTLTAWQGQLYCSAGGGIVADSEEAAEYMRSCKV